MRVARRGPSASPAGMLGPISWTVGRRGGDGGPYLLVRGAHRRRHSFAESVCGSGPLVSSPALTMCETSAAIVSRSAFSPLAISPVVPCGCSLTYPMMRPSMSSLCSRAVARRSLARRAVARRVERCGTTAGTWGAGSGEATPSTVGGVCMAENLLTLMEVPRERKRVRDPDAWINELGPGGLDHCLKPRASARSRFGDFRASEAEVLPAGSAQLPMLPPFRVRNKQSACYPRTGHLLPATRGVGPGPRAVHGCGCCGLDLTGCLGAFAS